MLTFQLHEEVSPSPFAPSCPDNESSGPHGPPVDPVFGKQVSAQLSLIPCPQPYRMQLWSYSPEENVPALTCTSWLLIEEEVLSRGAPVETGGVFYNRQMKRWNIKGWGSVFLILAQLPWDFTNPLSACQTNNKGGWFMVLPEERNSLFFFSCALCCPPHPQNFGASFLIC